MARSSVSSCIMTGNEHSPNGAEQTPVLVIAGPTASGKSGAALAVAEEFGGTVINSDSMQVYHELRILTARPSEEDEVEIPHRVYGVLSAAERCTAARWREMALDAIARSISQGLLPILCGGTGLYVKALVEGLSAVPEIPDDIKAALQIRLEREGVEALHAELAVREDPMAERLEPGDRQRVVRALAVLEATGKSLAYWQSVPSDGAPDGLCFHTLAFDPPREALYQSCNARFEAMARNGALEEVGALMGLQLDPGLPAMKALGVPEFIAHLKGETALEDAISAAQQSTRRYAKRQIIWIRNQMITNLHLPEQYSERIRDKIFSYVVKKRLTLPN